MEADLDTMPAAAQVVANPIDFVVPVRNRFAILDPIEGDIRSGVRGSTVEDGDVEVFPMADDAGEEVPRPPCRRLVLVPGPRDTHRSVQDSSRHGRFTASESGKDSLFLPVSSQTDDEGGVDGPLPPSFTT